MTPRATYRIQFNREFPFARAEAVVPYLDRLGISHIYASPITKARTGSLHGYDVVDPTQINPELGGEDALRSLVGALRARGTGLIIDIVPNHMGVAGGENPWWNDVLKHGPHSQYARYFDLDWRKRLLLPILGAPLEQVIADGDLVFDSSGAEPALVLYGDQRLPLRPDERPTSSDGDLTELLARQHYRLGWWRAANDELNWRRFFTINELAGLRVEDPEVFEAAHALYFRLYREGLIDGVRIDHVDGLSDPQAYCRRLRERLDGIERPPGAPEGPAYIVVEKILGAGERLSRDWGVDGTSGYDFMEEVSLLLHDPAGEAPLTALWHEFSGRASDFTEEELTARREMLSWAFEAQLAACVEAFHALAQSAADTRGLTPGMLRRAIERLLWVFPVYRTYGTGRDAPGEDAPVREQARAKAAEFTPPGEGEVSERVLKWLAGEGPGEPRLAADAVRRFQQLSAPIAAKAVEDTAFYRYGVLLSRTDVGFAPERFASSSDEFHQACAFRAAEFPHSILATATHDHKRGEDVRARLAVVSAIPQHWRDAVTEWDRLGRGSDVEPADRFILYQTLYGAWPAGLSTDDRDGLACYAERLCAWQTKALREAKLRSSWEQPNQGYEAACAAYIARLLDPDRSEPFLRSVQDFVDDTAAAASANSLVQTALRCLVPGVPDLYQCAELADYSLVDPDNRRPVDFARRETLLEAPGGEPKLALLHQVLQMRREYPDLFARGDYRPLPVEGLRADHVLAFARRTQQAELICAVVLRCAPALYRRRELTPAADWWDDTVIRDRKAGAIVARDAFSRLPVHASLG